MAKAHARCVECGICRHRSFYLYDATINNPLAAHDTVPAWCAYIIPFILMVITVRSPAFDFVNTVLIWRAFAP